MTLSMYNKGEYKEERKYILRVGYIYGFNLLNIAPKNLNLRII